MLNRDAMKSQTTVQTSSALKQNSSFNKTRTINNGNPAMARTIEEDKIRSQNEIQELTKSKAPSELDSTMVTTLTKPKSKLKYSGQKFHHTEDTSFDSRNQDCKSIFDLDSGFVSKILTDIEDNKGPQESAKISNDLSAVDYNFVTKTSRPCNLHQILNDEAAKEEFKDYRSYNPYLQQRVEDRLSVPSMLLDDDLHDKNTRSSRVDNVCNENEYSFMKQIDEDESGLHLLGLNQSRIGSQIEPKKVDNNTIICKEN